MYGTIIYPSGMMISSSVLQFTAAPAITTGIGGVGVIKHDCNCNCISRRLGSLTVNERSRRVSLPSMSRISKNRICASSGGGGGGGGLGGQDPEHEHNTKGRKTTRRIVRFNVTQTPEQACADIMRSLVTISATKIVAWELNMEGSVEIAEFLEENATDPDIIDLCIAKSPSNAMRLIDVRNNYARKFGWRLMKHLVTVDCEEEGLAALLRYVENTTVDVDVEVDGADTEADDDEYDNLR